MRKNIAFFGCSFTEGPTDDFDNYVVWLSKLNPQHNFYNFSAAGTSIMYHTYLLEQITKMDFDVKVFQFTTSGRFTTWTPHNIKEYIIKKYDNYFCLNKNYVQYIDRLNIGSVSEKKYVTYKVNFGKEYYKRMSDSCMDLDHRVYIDYIKPKVNFCFHHRKSRDVSIPSVYNSLDISQWNKFVIDDGDHFGLEGSLWQAKWLDKHLKERNIL